LFWNRQSKKIARPEKLSPLVPLPRVRGTRLEPGHPLTPGLVIRFSARPVEEAVAAVETTRAWANGFELLLRVEEQWLSWVEIRVPLTVSPASRVSAIACVVDFRHTVPEGTDSGILAREVDLACAALAAELNGRIEGTLSVAEVNEQHDELEARFESTDAAIEVCLLRSGGYEAQQILERLDELGFRYGGAGNYVWDNHTGAGDDQLIVACDSEAFGFYRTGSHRYAGIHLSMRPEGVPLPELVLERMIVAAQALRSAVGGEFCDRAGRRMNLESLRAAFQARLTLLREIGLVVSATAIE